jgi:hypothetical protein
MHCVPGFVISLRTLAPTPDVKCKDGLRVQVRLLQWPRQRRKAQNELEVDRVLRWRFPFESIQIGSQIEVQFHQGNDDRHITVGSGGVRRRD